MSLPRLDHVTHIADQLNELAAMVKTRSRASLTDANRLLETIATRFFNALFGWDLVNLNTEQTNYPAADLGDHGRRIAIQITNEDGSDKIKHTATKATEHKLGTDFDRLIIFFLLARKPGLPKKFAQPSGGPIVETWDIADLLKQLQNLPDLDALARAAKVLDEEMGRDELWTLGQSILDSAESVEGSAHAQPERRFYVGRIGPRIAADTLFGRDAELARLDKAWDEPSTHIISIIAWGGVGKTALLREWMARKSKEGWPNFEKAFDWSFYRQGAEDHSVAAADMFFAEALAFFGDEVMANSAAPSWKKAKRLASLVGKERTLLVLDGLEPLQEPKGPRTGQLKDAALAEFLRELALHNRGLCVLTSREQISDLAQFQNTTAPCLNLDHLPPEAGAELLHHLGVNRAGPAKIEKSDEELIAASNEVRGHALTLCLLGHYLALAHRNDVRRRDTIRFSKADEETQGGHAFRVMAAYETWLGSGDRQGQQQLALLRLMGLFDRPADLGCLNELREKDRYEPKGIPGLTELLVGLDDADWNTILTRLSSYGMVTMVCDPAELYLPPRWLQTEISMAEACGKRREIGREDIRRIERERERWPVLDAHPLVRQYFATILQKDYATSWKAAHKRLYDHLKNTSGNFTPVALHQPVVLQTFSAFYQAVMHACQAGEIQPAYKIYRDYILRGEQLYSWRVLGAYSTDLAVLTMFFEVPWTKPMSELKEMTSDVISNTANCLMRLGRVAEALELIGSATRAASPCRFSTGNVFLSLMASDIYAALGQLNEAEQAAANAIEGADAIGFINKSIDARATLASLNMLAGREAEALGLFEEAEARQKRQHRFHLLEAKHGYDYCKLLLSKTICEAWRIMLGFERAAEVPLLETLLAVESRAQQMLQYAMGTNFPIEIALCRLALGEAELARTIMESIGNKADSATVTKADEDLSDSANRLRASGQQDELPVGLMALAWMQILLDDSGKASSLLDEAWEIAQRGPMKLFLADIHLYRARLFSREKPYPWKSPEDDLAAAEKLINDCSYHRRDEELADAKHAILGT
jgi:tetratricopeptide (TPR) repeat protein